MFTAARRYFWVTSSWISTWNFLGWYKVKFFERLLVPLIKKIDVLKYCLGQKLWLRQLNYVSFVKKQVFTIRQSKISQKKAFMKALGLAVTPYSVKIVVITVIFFCMSFQTLIICTVQSLSGSTFRRILIH
jgi:hypothetical protein